MINTISKLWPRIGAFILDSIALGLIGQLIGLFANDYFATLNHQGLLVGLVISFIYFSVGYSKFTKGQTIGKRIIKLKVVDSKNAYLSISKSILRAAIITIPYFLLNYPLPFIIEDSPLNFYKSLILLVFLLCIILFVFFNKSTRQSFHDLLVGSYVVEVNSDSVKATPQVNQKVLTIFYGTMGGLLVIAVLFLRPNSKDESSSLFPHLEKVRIELFKLNGISNCSVTKATTTFLSKNRTVTKYLDLSLKTEFKPSFSDNDSKEIIEKAAMIAFNHYDSISNIDNIRIRLYYGYTIGIAKRYYSITDVWSVFEMMYPDSVKMDIVSSDEISYVENDLPEGEKKVITSYHDNGKLASESIYIDKKLEGTSRSWYNNGTLEYSIEYKNGQRNGLTINYFKNGQKESELHYKNNNLVKVLSIYDIDGNKLAIDD